jgi:hypothetical protein
MKRAACRMSGALAQVAEPQAFMSFGVHII